MPESYMSCILTEPNVQTFTFSIFISLKIKMNIYYSLWGNLSQSNTIGKFSFFCKILYIIFCLGTKLGIFLTETHNSDPFLLTHSITLLLWPYLIQELCNATQWNTTLPNSTLLNLTLPNSTPPYKTSTKINFTRLNSTKLHHYWNSGSYKPQPKLHKDIWSQIIGFWTLAQKQR
jgi:hypothetical protein